jgi:hypothetical protein
MNDWCEICKNRWDGKLIKNWCYIENILIGNPCDVNWIKCKGVFWKKGTPNYIKD